MVVTHPPRGFSFDGVNGSSSDKILLTLCDVCSAHFRRVAYSDGRAETGSGRVVQSEMAAFEFGVPNITGSTSGNQLNFSIKSPGMSEPAFSTLKIDFFDKSVVLEYLQGPEAPSGGNKTTIVALSSFPISTDKDASEQVLARFGDADAKTQPVLGRRHNLK